MKEKMRIKYKELKKQVSWNKKERIEELIYSIKEVKKKWNKK